MPRGTKAPNDWPAEPVSVMSIVPSASPCGCRLVSSWPSIVPTVRLTFRTVQQVRLGQNGRQVETGGLPVLDGTVRVEQVDPPHGLVQAAQAQCRQVLADLLGDVLEEGLDELRLAAEPGPQLRVLGRDADRAGVEMTDPHHDAAADDERGRREPELLAAEQRRNHDVATGLQLAVDLDDDPVTQPVEEQRLLRLGQAELPGRARVLQAGQR